MRKAALIIGIVCAVFAVLAVVLRVVGIPGSSILLTVFAPLFSVVSLGLFLGAAYRESANRLRRISLILFWLGLTDMLVGLLYGAMNWEGVMTILLQAVVLIVVAVILFLRSAEKSGVPIKWNSSFVIVAVIIYASVAVVWMTAKEQKIFGEEHVQAYTAETNAYAAANMGLDREALAFRSDTANASVLTDANIYLNKVDVLMNLIDGVKSRLIEEDNVRSSGQLTNDPEVVLHPEAYDFSTLLLVGEDAQHPTGRGVELYEALVTYRTDDLHEDISFVVPVSTDAEHKEQWVKDNFYHVPVIDVLTRLTAIQKNVVQSAVESIEKKLFVKQQ